MYFVTQLQLSVAFQLSAGCAASLEPHFGSHVCSSHNSCSSLWCVSETKSQSLLCVPLSVRFSCPWVCSMLCLHSVSHTNREPGTGQYKKRLLHVGTPQCWLISALCLELCNHRSLLSSACAPQVPLAGGRASPRSPASRHGQFQRAVGSICEHVLVRSV